MLEKRPLLTITDEGDGMFVISVGDRYSRPDYRWNLLGYVAEWFMGEDLPWLETADEHESDQKLIDRLMKKNPFDQDEIG